jgi:hypothetical protein
MVVAMIIVSLLRARFRIIQDWNWLRQSVRRGRAVRRSVPLGMFESFAFTPALLLIPLADTWTWLACFGLCVLAVTCHRLCLTERRPFRKPAPKKEKAEQPELAAA